MQKRVLKVPLPNASSLTIGCDLCLATGMSIGKGTHFNRT